MTKKEFLKELEEKLQGLPKDDLEERLEFYSEMIDDRIEEGKSEFEAVREIGDVDEVVSQIASETPLYKLVKEKAKPKRELKAWEIVLIIVGFPIWLPLLIVGFVLALVAYILIWILVIVTYAVELALIAGSIGCIIYFFAGGFNIAYLALGLLGLGFSVFWVFVCMGATKVTLKLSKKIGLGIKKLFISGGKKDE